MNESMQDVKKKHLANQVGLPSRFRTEDYEFAEILLANGRSASIARNLGEKDMIMFAYDGVVYQEYKTYKGMMCIGTKFKVYYP